MAWDGFAAAAASSTAREAPVSRVADAARHAIFQLVSQGAVERHRLDHALPGKQIGVPHIFNRCFGRHIDGLADRAADERLGRGHHADVPFDGDEPLARRAAGVGAVKDGQVLGLEVRRPLDGLGAADHVVEGRDLLARQAQAAEEVEPGIGLGGRGSVVAVTKMSPILAASAIGITR